MHRYYIPPTFFSPTHFLSMTRRSPRKKAISPETIAISDDEQQFMAIASDDQYVLLHSIELTRTSLMNINMPMMMRRNPSIPNSSHGKKNTKRTGKYGPFVPFV
jgi:hypothetical protein